MSIFIQFIKSLRYQFKSFCYQIYFWCQVKVWKLEIDSFKINGKLFIRNYGSIIIGSSFKVNSGKNFNPIGGDIITRIIVNKNSVLEIGDNVGISNSTLYAKCGIKICNNVLIGGGCRIWDTDFHSIKIGDRLEEKSIASSKPIIINNGVFIGGGVIILKGVEIGENSIVGAGSVVSKSIPENEIWAGNPAAFIRKITNSLHDSEFIDK